MAYDASFMTGSETRPVDPIGIGFHHNDQEIADLNGEHHVIHLTEGMLNQALESFEQATDLSGQLHASVRRGEKLSNTSYLLLKTSLKRVVRKSNAALDPLPAMESLDPYTQRELTMVMENVVTETIKNIWEKIKSTFIAMHNKIKTWFIKAFDGAGKLKNQATALKAKAEGLSAATAKNNQFDMSGVKFLNLNGKIPNAQEIGQGIELINSITGILLGKNADSYNNMFKQIEGALKDTLETAKKMKDSAISDKDKPEDGKQNIAEAFSGNVTGEKTGASVVKNATGTIQIATGAANKVTTGIWGGFFNMAKTAGIDIATGKEIKDSRWEGEKVFAYRHPKDFLGGLMLVASLPSATPDTIESYADFKNGFKISPEPIINPPKELDDNGSFITAPIALIISICENVISACDALMNYKLLFEARDKNTGNLMKQMEQAVSSNGGVKGVGEKHIQNTISATVAIIKKQQDGETRWAKYAFSVLNKSIVYCRNSLAQY